MPSQSTTSLKLENDTKERLQHLTESRKRTAHWLMREAIEQYVEREERQENLRKEALAAWEEYQLTGLHITTEEADEWLAKLEAGEDIDPPKCHI